MEKICIKCGKLFKGINKRRFCSQRCAGIYRNEQEPNLRFSAHRHNNFILNENTISFIDGHLLGDGSLSKPKTVNSGCRYSQLFSQKYNDWALMTQNKFNLFNIDNNLSYYSTYDKRTQKTYYSVSLQTHVYDEFLIFYKRWYPNGKKEIPKDLKINPQLMRVFYLDDGYIRGKKQIQFSTDSFSDESINFLIDKLKEINLSPKTNSKRIHLYRSSDILSLLSYMNTTEFPNCFKYKGGIVS